MMKKSSPALIRSYRKTPPVVVPIGIGLNDAREECFCLLVCDGVPLAIAYKTAGFSGKDKSSSAVVLYQAQRIQERCTAILKARASHPAVSLPEVTDMLKRVYAGALHSGEYSPAHNAAFSLARLYGLVVDRAQLDVVRRPSREPDAPAEQSLASWIQDLPSLPKPVEAPLAARAPLHMDEPRSGSRDVLPVSPVRQTNGISSQPIDIIDVAPSSPHSGHSMGRTIEATAFGSDLDQAHPQTGNGAPVRPVTGTPSPGGRNQPEEILPTIEDLFG